MPYSSHNYGLIGLKPARCKESAAGTGFVNPLSRRDAADGRFKANPSGGGQEAAGFVARRQRMHPYTILLASRPQPPGPPSTRNYGWNRALATVSKQFSVLLCRRKRHPRRSRRRWEVSRTMAGSYWGPAPARFTTRLHPGWRGLRLRRKGRVGRGNKANIGCRDHPYIKGCNCSLREPYRAGRFFLIAQ